MKNKNILVICWVMLAGLLSVSCEERLDDVMPMVEFDLVEYPYVDRHITINEDVAGANVVLGYRNGGGRTVEMEVENIVGVYADKISVTLNEDDGIIELPLKGSCALSGLQDLRVRVHYDDLYIFCPFQIGVRPQTIEEIKITQEPQLTGFFLRDISSEAYVTFGYMHGWGRSVSVTFDCEDEGFSDETQSFRLALDATPGSLRIPVIARPSEAGTDVSLKMILEMEDCESPVEYTFMFDINEPVPYVQEEVRQYLIVTDRNELINDASVLETKEFVYNTVFVDMNGDGYVTDNYEIWLDRNVGATSTDVTSEDSYGFHYQVTRNAPGYIRNSQNGGYWDGEMKSVSNLFCWYNGVSSNATDQSIADITVEGFTIGPKNPCPEGYRMPTGAELTKLMNYLGSDVESYTGDPLNLPLPGEYNGNTANGLTDVGNLGTYWSCPVNGGQVSTLLINSATGVVKTENRTKGSGCVIRCVKARPEEIRDYSYSANPTSLITPSLPDEPVGQ